MRSSSPRGNFFHAIPRNRRGVALIIVLAFVVLLTVLVVAFFSRAMSERQISTASSGQVKVDLLAEGAMNSILGDLKQEISAGSIVTSGSIAGSGTTYSICVPASQWAAVPCVSGTTGGAQWLPPNVLKRSARGQPFYSGTNYTLTNNYISATVSGTAVTTSTSTLTYTASNRAAMVSSTAAALNGRYVSMDRWNKPLLIPTVTGTGPTPLLSGTMADGTNWAYAAPDWVLVDRSGNNPTPATTAVPSTLQWSSSGSATVVGRYAYTIYDEGGLLDMNVAGHPTAVSGTTVTVKSSLAMADLTQIGLSSTEIDAIVTNWRNPATYQQSGNFRDNMLAIDSTNGFRGVNPAVAGDNAFPSRQSLINFLLEDVSTSGSTQAQLQTALQYMGTFSRSLEQPSFSPNPNRPRIINPGVPPPVLSSTNGYSGAGNYAGNNDAAGGDDLINVPFLSVRVTGTFTRMDGSIAQIGEPLVKKRFPLSRLSWITYAGPSATAPATVQNALLAVGVSQATINAGTAANIYSAFGLTWTGTGTWTYNHAVNNSSGQLIIGKLTDAAAANREPDFFELLKAAINVGSLAKAAPNLPIGGDYEYQYVIDSSVDYNLLQIGVNLIDQVTPDSIPIVVQIQASSAMRSFRGVEDLPYFFRFHPFSVVTQQPAPLFPNSSTITLKTGETVTSSSATGTVTTGSGAGTLTFTNACPVALSGALTQTGSAYLFYVPEVWNPHDANGDPNISKANTTLRPTAFRVTLDSADPAGLSTWQDSAQISPKTSSTGTNGTRVTPGNGSQDPTAPVSPIIALNSSTNSRLTMVFSDNNGQLYREPTLLWRARYPTGSNLGLLGGGVIATDVNTNKTYVGMPLGQCPVSVQVSVNGTVTTSSNVTYNGQNSFIIQGSTINEGPTYFPPVSPSSHMYTFRLQYQNTAAGSVTGTNWITYDEKYADNHNLGTPSLVVNPTDYPNLLFENPLLNNHGVTGNGQLADTSGVIDPLSARFGVGLGYTNLGMTSTSGYTFQTVSAGYVPEPLLAGSWSWSANTNAAFNGNVNASNFTILESDRPRTDYGIYVDLSNPCMGDSRQGNEQMRWFSGLGFYGDSTAPFEFCGLLSQNNPAITFTAQNGRNAASLYYEDADGVARRAMGAYAETSMSLAASTVGLPEITADSFATNPEGVPTPLATGQSESRSIVLNRPFRSVAEMSYASRGLPWKNIDFFTPESGDTALLDVFCVNELPSSNLVAGKVNVNTRQPLVLQAILAGAYEDELKNISSPPSVGALGLSGSLSVLESSTIAQTQVIRSIDTNRYWHGPLANIGELVGRYVTTMPTITGTASYTDPYTYLQPSFPPGADYPPATSGKTIVYSGLSGALSSSSTNGTITSTLFVTNNNAALIQRGREAAIRPFADCGQARVWNLMIDVVAQSGRYPQGASDLTKFQVDGEKRYWVHVAIDRYTGAVIDKQVEVVTE